MKKLNNEDIKEIVGSIVFLLLSLVAVWFMFAL